MSRILKRVIVLILVILVLMGVQLRHIIIYEQSSSKSIFIGELEGLGKGKHNVMPAAQSWEWLPKKQRIKSLTIAQVPTVKTTFMSSKKFVATEPTEFSNSGATVVSNFQWSKTQSKTLAINVVKTGDAMTLRVTNEHNNTGYVLAIDYWEQMTSGSRNLQSLQCWAAQFNLSVVEPMALGSVLKMPLKTPLKVSDKFWFHNIFDMDMWNHLSANLSHSQLVPWDDFLINAPRNVILVSFKYYKEIKSSLKTLPTPQEPHISPSQRLKKGCSTHWDSVSNFLKSYHFQIVREVCLNFGYGDQLTIEQYNAHVYGGFAPNSATVIYWQWRGMGPPTRVLIQNNKCGNIHTEETIGPSQTLLQVAAEYQQKYLHGRPYLAVMARLEKVKIGIRKGKLKQSLQGCSSKLLSVWKEIQKESGLNVTFLAADVGRFGSNSYHYDDNGTAIFENIFELFYGPGFSVENWEDSFQTVANTTDAGYIGQLQSVLVAHAKCVVFIGGGSFQRHAMSRYLQAHPNTQCIRVVRECSTQ